MAPALLHPLLALTAALAAAAPGNDGALHWGVGATLGTEYDSNARRAVQEPLVVADGLVRSSLSGELGYRQGPWAVGGSTVLGAKVFAQQRSENMVAGLVNGSAILAPMPGLELALDLSARARHLLAGTRDFAHGSLDGALRWAPLPTLLLQVALGPRAFHYLPSALYSSAGAGLSAWLRWRLLDRELLMVGYDGEVRQFPSAQRILAITAAGDIERSGERRGDQLHSCTMALTTTRLGYAQLSYTLLYNASSSLGETYLRHRAQVSLAVRLPLDLTAAVGGNVQLTRYPGGLAISQSLLLADADESQNALTLALSRPLLGGVNIEWRLGLFANELSDSGLRFARTTMGLGLSYRR